MPRNQSIVPEGRDHKRNNQCNQKRSSSFREYISKTAADEHKMPADAEKLLSIFESRIWNKLAISSKDSSSYQSSDFAIDPHT